MNWFWGSILLNNPINCGSKQEPKVNAERRRKMRWIISALVVLVMMFAMVSISGADFFSEFFSWSPYRCGVASPAYPDYIDARALPCPVSVKKPNTPVNAGDRDANR